MKRNRHVSSPNDRVKKVKRPTLTKRERDKEVLCTSAEAELALWMQTLDASELSLAFSEAKGALSAHVVPTLAEVLSTRGASDHGAEALRTSIKKEGSQ
jgi:hypothetical protein